MNYFDLYSSYPDPTIAAAWDSQVKEADKTSWLADKLAARESELFARFAACYANLRALPRGARRALQRRIARSTELAATLPEHLQHGGRRLQHRMAWSLAGAALLLALGHGVATAATITVTTNNPNIVADGQCSLIEAIINANNDAATHANCAAGNGADTIVLPANANLTLSNPNAVLYSHPIGLPLITSRITIEGNGAVIARQGSAPDFGLMAITNSGDLTLQRVTLSGGQTFARGGGLVNYGGALTINNSTISGNTANYGGGGVKNSGDLTIENSTISGNNAPSYFGGGVSNYGTITIQNSTISGNTAYDGGGVSNFGTVTIENSTIAGNTANVGGAVHNYGGGLAIINSTISGNRANAAGGVLNKRYYSVECRMYFSCYGTLTLSNSVIAGNQAPVAPEIDNASIVNAGNFNLFGTNGNAGVTGFTPGPTDIVPSVPLAQILGPLKNNGGPTKTHALVPGSPAIDAGKPSGCRDSLGALLLKDQRGFHRPVDGNNDGTVRCDIGAVEFGAGSAAPVDFDGDGKPDVAVYQASSGDWFFVQSTGGFDQQLNFGGPGFLPVPADYDGDGEADVGVYQQSTGDWFVVGSTSGLFQVLNFGGSGYIPVPGDYDADGKVDVAVYQTSTGNWFVMGSTAGFFTPALSFGGAGFIPVPGDYDGDGETDVAVYQNSSGNWFVVGSSRGFFSPALNFGGTGFIPVPGDYDGDGKSDPGVYQSGTGNWFAVGSISGFRQVLNFGGVGFTPVAGDYDGDGKTDAAVYQSSTGNWFVVGSTSGFFTPALNFGGTGFVPVLLQVTILRALGLL